VKIEHKTKILILTDYYLPGYKSGGGMRTIVNIVERFKDKFDFWIITRDHDGKLDRRPYTNVKIDDWNKIGDANVFYMSAKNLKLRKLRDIISEIRPEEIYINSVFADFSVYTLLLRKARLLPTEKIIIAPCGELSGGALALKSSKKKAFLKFSKLFGLYENIIWKASSEREKTEIEKVKGRNGKIFVAPDLPPQTFGKSFSIEQKPLKKIGEAKMVFLSRFVRIKNFKYLLKQLNKVKGKLEIDVAGPIEQKDYWNECLEIIKTLPENIKIQMKGNIPNEQVHPLLLEYHFFILPTLSENFGHVLLEALSAGCPLIVSDRTPWRKLSEKKIGWDIPLEIPHRWTEIINFCIDLDNDTYSNMSKNARAFSTEWMSSSKIESDTLKIFDYALSNTLS